MQIEITGAFIQQHIQPIHNALQKSIENSEGLDYTTGVTAHVQYEFDSQNFDLYARIHSVGQTYTANVLRANPIT